MTKREINLLAAKILDLDVFSPESKPDELYYYFNQRRIYWNPIENSEQARMLVKAVCKTDQDKQEFLNHFHIYEEIDGIKGSFEFVLGDNPSEWTAIALVIASAPPTDEMIEEVKAYD
jgi:hypothetical protein